MSDSASNLRSPAEIVDYVAHGAVDKAALPLPRLGLMAVLGGIYIALGGLLALVVAGGMTGLASSDPGLVKLVFGAVFPLGFIAVVLTGVDLFTSNCATQTVAAWRREIGGADMARVLGVSYAGNFVGALLAALCFGWLTGILVPGEPWTAYLLKLAQGKLSHPFWMTFMKGVLANLLVCLAAWQGYSARDTLGRMVAIWLPVMAFVALGLEHSIANMFFIPAAMLAGLDVSWGQFIWANLVPATLGNLVGGAVVFGLAYAVLYPAKQPAGNARTASAPMADPASAVQ
ncbi:formate/nitrite transporter family protein [Chitinolyticbacter meiyuanensis]|uniref:formate/nitrite transporter family protein n=1 Tax=Chitinolyticbacter meiyuanensis TaxID=682798 RepID=UPI0011E5FB41|nr:formate/nitrite transporter family protein [Chitinolyticbacter meiyuanensis]